MIIVAGRLYVRAGSRDRFLALSRPAMEAARAHPACRDFVVAADPLEPDRVNVYERWDAWAPLRAFRADGPSPELGALIERSAVAEYAADVMRPAQTHPPKQENP